MLAKGSSIFQCLVMEEMVQPVLKILVITAEGLVMSIITAVIVFIICYIN